jgi:hypothetical protein
MIDHICRCNHIENIRLRLPSLAHTQRNYPSQQESDLPVLPFESGHNGSPLLQMVAQASLPHSSPNAQSGARFLWPVSKSVTLLFLDPMTNMPGGTLYYNNKAHLVASRPRHKHRIIALINNYIYLSSL